MYRDFEKDKIRALTALRESEEYKALYEDSHYYRAAWLAQRMEHDEDTDTVALRLLMRAVWEAD